MIVRFLDTQKRQNSAYGPTFSDRRRTRIAKRGTMRPISALILVLVAACGGTRGTPAPPVEAAPPDRLSYRPATVLYAAASHQQIEQDISGRTQSSRIVTRYVLRTEIGPAADGMPVTMVLDSIVVDGQLGVSESEIAAAQGTGFAALLQSTGELTGFTGGDTTMPLVRRLTSRLSDFFPRIPPDGAQPDQRWSDSTESVTDVGGVLLTVRAANGHEALDWTSYAGRRALAIRTVSDYTLSGTGEQSGQSLSLDGSGRRHAIEYLSAEGVYLGATAADTLEFEVLLTQIGMVIPGRQWSADTIVAVN